MATRKAGAQQPDTKTKLLDAAERLFGRHSLDGVSMRQIATEAGSSNHFVVQYHFGDKEALAKAIFERRLASLEIKRAAALDEVKRAGRINEIRALIEVLLLPIADERDENGERAYAAFLASRYVHEGIRLREELADAAPLALYLNHLLHSKLPHLTQALYNQRMASTTAMFCHALVVIDRERRLHATPLLPEALAISEALDQVAAILEAPVSPEVQAALVE